MKQMKRFAVCAAAMFGLMPAGAGAQSFDVTGTRAAGMGGAFVAVADDATALYWNPAGLAAGSYFSLAVDRAGQRAVPEAGPLGTRQSSFFLGLTTPALGLSYYRLHQSTAAPRPLLVPIDTAAPNRNLTGADEVHRTSLTTHHAGLTLVQSLLPGVAVGATLKLVRGFTASRMTAVTTARQALDEDSLATRGTTRFDADLGVMASTRRLKAGVTLRNLREPEFTSDDGAALTLEREIRGGVSVLATANWLVAADMDLLTTHDVFGERRNAAAGVEGRLGRRTTVRAGVKMNLADDDEVAIDKSARGVSLGTSFALTPAVFIDTVGVTGGDRAGRSWGLSARFVY
jgi:hypothetical protein